MEILGLDIGFSATRPTSGVARLSGNNLVYGRATSTWKSKLELLGDCVADVAAIDGPLLLDLNCQKRACEYVFTLGLFSRRCKPGLSHIPGTGRRLREAAQETAKHLASLTGGHDLTSEFPRVWAGKNLVEAFPNAFLGVLIPGARFDARPGLSRGKKFDWLYEQCSVTLAFRRVIDAIGPKKVRDLLQVIEANRDHEERAALVCLLTAAAVALGRYTAVGDEQGGYFFLPPWNSWAEWARQEINRQRRRARSIEVWVNGERFIASDSLPSVA